MTIVIVMMMRVWPICVCDKDNIYIKDNDSNDMNNNKVTTTESPVSGRLPWLLQSPLPFGIGDAAEIRLEAPLLRGKRRGRKE